MAVPIEALPRVPRHPLDASQASPQWAERWLVDDAVNRSGWNYKSRWIALVRMSSLPARPKLVAHVLYSHTVGRDGGAPSANWFSSISSMVSETSLRREEVVWALKVLVQLGWVSKAGREGPRSAEGYRLCWPLEDVMSVTVDKPRKRSDVRTASGPTGGLRTVRQVDHLEEREETESREITLVAFAENRDDDDLRPLGPDEPWPTDEVIPRLLRAFPGSVVEEVA